MKNGLRMAPRLTRAIAVFDEAERSTCMLLNCGARARAIRGFFAAVSRLGNGVFWYVLMALLAATQGPPGRVAALQMALSGLVGLGIYKALKSRLVRERPFVSHAGIACGAPPLDRYSFPSGHTLHAVLFTSIALAWFPHLAVVLVPFAVLVAASRVVLGLHYPTDVVVGALIGWALARASLWLYAPVMLPPG
jgi:undecaprenyl-diphosphatase